MEQISITTDTIQLDQFLKWIGVIESGAQVKFLIADGLIRVNGILITERRKKLYPGDNIEVVDLGSWSISKQVNV
ncbi:MAG: putative binding protein [Firmicutes bacterium]|nr:putative binding protein [Bacillota bacterium]